MLLLIHQNCTSMCSPNTHGRRFHSSRVQCWPHGPGIHWHRPRWLHTEWAGLHPAHTGQRCSLWSNSEHTHIVVDLQMLTWKQGTAFCYWVLCVSVCACVLHWGWLYGDTQQRDRFCPGACRSIQSYHKDPAHLPHIQGWWCWVSYYTCNAHSQLEKLWVWVPCNYICIHLSVWRPSIL